MKTNLVWHAITGLLLSGIATEIDLSSGQPLIRLNHALQAAEPITSATSTSWKLDYDILHSATYQGHYSTFSKGHLKVDQDDQLWMPLTILFPGDENTTDAWSPLARHITLFSKNRGRTWEITSPAKTTPVANRVTMADRTLLEVSSSGYFRFPRTEIRQLEQKGYQVWDLGPQEDYCAIIYDLIARRSTDGGKTWTEEIVLRDNIPLSDALAEPTTVELADGTLFTAFQGKKLDDQGRPWEFIGGCHWSRDYRRPWSPKLEVPQPTQKFNAPKSAD